MKKEWDDSEKQNGMSPVQYLDKIGVLGPDVVAAHCIFVDEADRKILAKYNVGCVHNPSSNMMIASGYLQCQRCAQPESPSALEPTDPRAATTILT
jgi:5-methylthioadenosine/S-adenosylhomocysteine deaminase